MFLEEGWHELREIGEAARLQYVKFFLGNLRILPLLVGQIGCALDTHELGSGYAGRPRTQLRPILRFWRFYGVIFFNNLHLFNEP